MQRFITIIAVLATSVLAAPLEARANTCPADIDPVYLALVRPIDKAAASNFCSSFVKVTQTSTAYVTDTATSTATVTNSVVVTNTIPPVTTATITVTQPLATSSIVDVQVNTQHNTVTSVVSTSTILSQIYQTQYYKRADTPSLPSFVAIFAPSDISSACKRIVTPATSIITTTSTATSVLSSTVTVSLTNSVQVTPNPTAYVTVTAPQSTETVHVTSQTTVTVNEIVPVTTTTTATTTIVTKVPICGGAVLVKGNGQYLGVSVAPLSQTAAQAAQLGWSKCNPSTRSSVTCRNDAANQWTCYCWASTDGAPTLNVFSSSPQPNFYYGFEGACFA